MGKKNQVVKQNPIIFLEISYHLSLLRNHPDLSFFSQLLRGAVNSHNSAAYVFLGLGRALRAPEIGGSSDLYGFYRYVNIWVYGGLMGLYIYYGLIWFKKGMICWDIDGYTL